MGESRQTVRSDDYDETKSGFRIRAVALDFKTKTEHKIKLDQMEAAWEQGQYVWVDIEVSDTSFAFSGLSKLELTNPQVIIDALSERAETRCSRYDDHWHLVLADCAFRNDDLIQHRVDVVLAENYMITIHRAEGNLIPNVLADYQQDFKLYAQTPSFLVYEIWDGIIESFNSVEERFEQLVRDIQQQLIQGINDDVFARVQRVSNDLMEFRSVLRPAGALLTELSTRKNAFISTPTQGVLINMVATVERMLQDVLSARETLADSLNLHMSMVAYRTNEGVNKLTAVNMIFLPLTFMCGLYGMNFEVMPELKWEYGYLLFWVAAIAVVIGLTVLMRRMKML